MAENTPESAPRGLDGLLPHAVLAFVGGRIADICSWAEDGTYTWNRGYETLKRERFTYQGQYHPNRGLCEPEPWAEPGDWEGLCCWCGTVWFSTVVIDA